MPRIVVLLLVVVLVFAGCGKSSSTSGSAGSSGAGQVHLAKTKFVLHAGLAFGAFHRYIYKPYRAGKLGGGLFHNKAAKIKAALAAAFAYHELKLALSDARSSRVLSRVLAPVLALQTKLGSLRSGLKRGDTGQVPAANTDLGAVSSSSRSAGQPVGDQPTPSLGG